MNKFPKIKWAVATSVAFITFLVYLPTLQNEFINWDDNDYIYKNFFIRSLDTQLLKSAFTQFHEANWHPLTWLSHALDYAIWGLNPLGHHLTNNILHAVNTFLVIFLVVSLLETANSERRGKACLAPTKPISGQRGTLIAASITGLLFGIHPIHVESVAWAAERKDLLCGLFYLLSVMAYVKYAGNTFLSFPLVGNPSEIAHNTGKGSGRVYPPSAAPKATRAGMTKQGLRFPGKHYLLSLGFFILALLSKPMAVSLPFVLLILDWYPFRRIQSLKTFWAASIEKLPFLALMLISSVLTILAQEAGGAMKSVAEIPLASRMIVAAEALIAYLVKMILPLNLVPLYPYPDNISLFSVKYMVPIVIVAAITTACMTVVRSRKLWTAVWSYYVITLLPVLGLVQVGHQSMADRYTYLPCLGPFLVIGILAAKAYEKASALNKRGALLKMAGLFIAMTMLVSISYATIKQIGIWKNSIVFWNYVIEKYPSVALAHDNLGDAYLSEGQFDMAIEQDLTALSLKPDDVGSHNNLGAAYLSKGLFDMAMEEYRTALSLKPNDAVTHYNLGYAYLSRGQLDMAIEQFLTVLRLRPNDAEAHNNLGNAYVSEGQLEAAIEQYRAALALEPNLAEVHYNLGNVYISTGSLDMAIEQFRTALSLKKDFAGAHYKLGLGYLEKGRKDAAQAEFELELAINPGHTKAREALNSIISR